MCWVCDQSESSYYRYVVDGEQPNHIVFGEETAHGVDCPNGLWYSMSYCCQCWRCMQWRYMFKKESIDR